MASDLVWKLYRVYRVIRRSIRKVRYRHFRLSPYSVIFRPIPKSVSISIPKQDGKAAFCDEIFTHHYRVENLRESPIVYGKHRIQRDAAALIDSLDPGYQQIDWERDFICEYRWQRNAFYTGIHYGGALTSGSADIKVPWEVSRFQHLLKNLSHNHHRLAICEILDFVASQPPFHGPNWRCAMDVAIRAINLIFARSELFAWVEQYLPAELTRFTRLYDDSLWHHYQFVLENLEYNGLRSNNHYFANISGLYILASHFGRQRVKRFAASELASLIKNQFYPDGINFEASLPYHRMTAELALYPFLYAQIQLQGKHSEQVVDEFNADYLERLQTIFSSFQYLTTPAGTIPNIGDNDSGCIIKWNKTAPSSTLSLNSFAKHMLGVVHFRPMPGCPYVVDFLSSNRLGLSAFCKDTQSYSNSPIIHTFDDAGILVYRSERIYFITHYGPPGQRGNSGHDHSDRLSYELYLDNQPVVIDRGNFNYTAYPDLRNVYRAIASHNLPQWNCTGEPLEQYISKSAFSRKVNIVLDKASVVSTGSGVDVKICVRYGDQHDIQRAFSLIESASLVGLTVSDSLLNKPDVEFLSNRLFLFPANYQVSEEVQITASKYAPEYLVQKPCCTADISALRYSIEKQFNNEINIRAVY